MFAKFKTQQLIFITLWSVIVFVADLLLVVAGPQGSPQQVITIPLSLIVSGMAFILLLKISPRFGTLTLFSLIYAVLEFPTPLGVAPGFWPKILINIFSGFLGDIFVYAFRYRTWSIYVGACICGLINQILFIVSMIWLGIPLTTKLSVFIIPVVLFAFISLAVGMWFGLQVWKKIRYKKIIRQLV